MEKLLSRNINWSVFLTHPLELIKIDSALKLKAHELRNADCKNNELIELEFRKHIRLIYNFRCFLQLMSKDILYFNFPDSHRLEISQSWNSMEEDRIKTLMENDFKMDINTLHANELYMFLSAAADYEKTKKLFRDVLFKLFQKLQFTCNRDMLNVLTEKVNFRVSYFVDYNYKPYTTL